jgi:serine protease
MRNALVIIALSASLSSHAIAADVRGTKADDVFRYGVPQDHVAGRALIKLRGIDAHRLVLPKATDTAAQVALKNLAARTNVDLELVRPVVFGWALVEVRFPGDARIPTESETLALVEDLAADQAIEHAQEQKWLRPLLVPNDPGYIQMWHLQMIGADEAWDLTQGLSSQRVGIVDTGLARNHEDVGSRAVGGFDFMASGGNDGNGRDSDFADVGDQCGQGFHGTHTAGTVGAAGNNAIGVTGLNWNAGLMIARVLGDCGGSIDDIGEGAAWLAGAHIDGVPDVGVNRVSVMNLSLGSASSCSGFEQDVVDFVNEQGVIFVAAAGNDGGAVGSPANCTGALGVAAHGPDRDLTDYSSFGGEIDIVAPGGDQSQGNENGVLSTVGPNSDFYAFFQGTSMASPHVAGTVSLMQARDPSITLSEVISILQSTGTSCGGCGTKKAMLTGAAVAAVAPVGEGEGEGEGEEPPPVATDDALEENDDFDTAKGGVSCNATRSDLVAAPDDQDWFILNTSEGQEVQIDLDATNGADLDLYVLDGPTNNDNIAASETATGNESVSFTSPGGALRVAMNPFFDQTNNIHHNGPYTLAVVCTGGEEPSEGEGEGEEPPAEGEGEGEEPPTEEPIEEPVGVNPDAEEDELEDNDEIGAAQELFCDEERDLTLKDDDFFIVEVREGDAIAVNVTAGDLALETSVLDANGALATGDGASTALTGNLRGGRYVVEVHPTGPAGTYKLQIACKPNPPQKIAPVKAGGGFGCSESGASSLPLAAFGMLLLLARRRR